MRLSEFRGYIRIAMYFFVAAIFMLPALIFGFIFLLFDYEPIDDWLFFHGMEWLEFPIGYILITLPLVPAVLAYFVFERCVSRRLADWIINMIPLPGDKR